jgi:hypothetical protein
MTIKDVAFEFFRKIFDSPSVDEIKAVVNKLKSPSNKIYPTPVLGLLLYNQHKVKRYVGRTPTNELSSWEECDLKLLFGVHNQIRQFNRLCLAPLEAGLPEAINAINPYKEYPQPVSTEGFEELLFNQEDAEEIIKTFHTHPAFNIALSNLETVRERPLDYDQTVWQFNDEIVQAGPGNEPEWVKRYDEAKHSDHPSVALYRHVAAIISLHNSLATLDQFIYHEVLRAEIMTLNRSQIVDYFWTTGHVGPGMWLLHISQLHMFVCEPTDLIIVNVDMPGEKGGLGDTLCSIHSMTIPGTNGGPSKFGLRMIDDNLNAYRYLLQQ